MNTTLQTERLLLRLCTANDLDLFASTWGDAEVMQTFGPGVPVLPEYIEQHLDEYIEGYQAGQRIPWSLILRENSEKSDSAISDGKMTNPISFLSVTSSEKSIGGTVTPQSLPKPQLNSGLTS